MSLVGKEKQSKLKDYNTLESNNSKAKRNCLEHVQNKTVSGFLCVFSYDEKNK